MRRKKSITFSASDIFFATTITTMINYLRARVWLTLHTYNIIIIIIVICELDGKMSAQAKIKPPLALCGAHHVLVV
jgi:hypothetical protein